MQNVKGVKVTEKVKIVKRKFCIKKTHRFTIIAMNYVQEQLITSPYLLTLYACLSSSTICSVPSQFFFRNVEAIKKKTCFEMQTFCSCSSKRYWRHAHEILQESHLHYLLILYLLEHNQSNVLFQIIRLYLLFQ